MKLKSTLAIAICVFTIAANAVTPAYRKNVTNHNYWGFYTGSHKLNSKFSLYTEFQWRRSEGVSKFLQEQIRTSLDYKLNDVLTISPGYVATWTEPYGHAPAAYGNFEHRIYEQFVMQNRNKRFYFTHRFRFEQRFGEHKALNKATSDYEFDEYVYKNRIRYRVLFNLPLNNKEMIDKTAFIQAYDELFMNWGKNVEYNNVFDQNRFFMGLGYRFNKDFNIVAGYLNQGIMKGTSKMFFENNQTAVLNINYSLDFSKKEVAK